ncbi:RNA polymerase, Rpb8 [Corchorus olitorius]|uniref:RNA polymerase, Rpb8 n=1 Tax=Corchorus olitorius TaxID=93759 RepID=A0A1R3L0B5_9ROSI|nr:RNA polymerase, Rpb8 [Corchorus olitorius]
MSGKLFRIADTKEGSSDEKDGSSDEKQKKAIVASESATKVIQVELNFSFGGLLMMLKGKPSNYFPLASFELDQKIFLLLRKP